MKEWIALILTVPGWIDKVCGRIDDRAAAYAGTVMQTERQADIILRLFDVKRKLINLWVLYRGMAAACGKPFGFLMRFVRGESVSDIAVSSTVSRSGVYRRIKSCFAAAEKYLVNCGFDGKRLEREYLRIPLINELYERISGGLAA